MLRSILKLLTKPIKANKQSSSTKHLVIQTVYSGSQPDTTLLAKQQAILLNRPAFKDSLIEICLIDKNIPLIGLTRHPKTEMIMGGIFMYPESVYQSNEWDNLSIKAGKYQAGIAIFKPMTTVNCLKITLDRKTKSHLYLINNRDVSPTQWLLQPSKL